MKRLIAIALICLPGFTLADGSTVEIQVQGMTCPFCVYGVKKSLNRLPGVDEAEVSLQHKLARIVMTSGRVADEAAIRQAILDAGFTPGELTVTKTGDQP